MSRIWDIYGKPKSIMTKILLSFLPAQKHPNDIDIFFMFSQHLGLLYFPSSAQGFGWTQIQD